MLSLAGVTNPSLQAHQRNKQQMQATLETQLNSTGATQPSGLWPCLLGVGVPQLLFHTPWRMGPAARCDTALASCRFSVPAYCPRRL